MRGTEREEFTDAKSRLADCRRYSLRVDDPLMPLASALAQSGRAWRVVVSWTTHDLLGHDWDRWGEYQDVIEAVSQTLATVLDALGYEVGPFGSGGASVVTGRRSGGQVAR